MVIKIIYNEYVLLLLALIISIIVQDIMGYRTTIMILFITVYQISKKVGMKTEFYCIKYVREK